MGGLKQARVEWLGTTCMWRRTSAAARREKGDDSWACFVSTGRARLASNVRGGGSNNCKTRAGNLKKLGKLSFFFFIGHWVEMCVGQVYKKNVCHSLAQLYFCFESLLSVEWVMAEEILWPRSERTESNSEIHLTESRTAQFQFCFQSGTRRSN